LGEAWKEGRIGSAPGFAVGGAPPPPKKRLWPWVVLGVVALLAAVFGALAFLAQRRVETFSLRLDLKTPQGVRTVRVAGGEVIIEETPLKGPPSSVNCAIGMRESLKVQTLVRTRLLDQRAAEPFVGTFMTSAGSGSDDASSGEVDAEQAAAVADLVVKLATGCVHQP